MALREPREIRVSPDQQDLKVPKESLDPLDLKELRATKV